MGEAEFYCLHGLVLEVRSNRAKVRNDLAKLLQGLSWVKVSRFAGTPNFRFLISVDENGFELPTAGHECFRAAEFRGLEAGDDFYLTDGSSHFHLQSAQAEGRAHLAASFSSKSALAQANFWSFSLLKLLRSLGIYSLHAAGVATGRIGVLIVGPSGSGKSTLAVGLLRAGWGYLSDDAVLVRRKSNVVEALALRKNFYIDSDQSSRYSDLPLGGQIPDAEGRQRRRVCVEEAFAEQPLRQCIPSIILFPKIVSDNQSTLVPIDRVYALSILLAQSGPQLFDRKTMPRHLDLLRSLIQQTAVYELKAGADLYRDAGTLVHLLEQAEGERTCDALLSN